MKIRVGQLRKIIKEEVARTLLRESPADQVAAMLRGSGDTFLRGLLKRMAEDPGSAEELASMWDEYCCTVKDQELNSRSSNEEVQAAAENYGPEGSRDYFDAAKWIRTAMYLGDNCPTGASLVAASQEKIKLDAEDRKKVAASLAGTRATPDDPYAGASGYAGTSGRYVGD